MDLGCCAKSQQVVVVGLSMKDARHGTHSPLTLVDGLRDADIDVLKLRADSLRRTAEGLHEILAVTYRRRASELEMEWWLMKLRTGQAVDPLAA